MRPHLRRPAAMQRAVIPLWRRRPGQPSTSDAMHNAKVMRWDAVAMGVVNAASTYLPVLVARLGGSAFTILCEHAKRLTPHDSMPGMTACRIRAHDPETRDWREADRLEQEGVP